MPWWYLGERIESLIPLSIVLLRWYREIERDILLTEIQIECLEAHLRELEEIRQRGMCMTEEPAIAREDHQTTMVPVAVVAGCDYDIVLN